MTPLVKAIEKHLEEVLCFSSMPEELRYYLENNCVLDEEGDEVDFVPRDFEWSVELKLKLID